MLAVVEWGSLGLLHFTRALEVCCYGHVSFCHFSMCLDASSLFHFSPIYLALSPRLFAQPLSSFCSHDSNLPKPLCIVCNGFPLSRGPNYSLFTQPVSASSQFVDTVCCITAPRLSFPLPNCHQNLSESTFFFLSLVQFLNSLIELDIFLLCHA